MKTAFPCSPFSAAVALTLLASAVCAQNAPITLHVDATDATRQILHARLRIPARPGPLTLVYPKWIPGEHGPTGPITDLVGLKMNSAGRQIEWRRDAEDMYAFDLEVPAGADAVEVGLDYLLALYRGEYLTGGAATAQLLDLSWNHVLLYPKGARATDLQFVASLRLPAGWKFGTALPVARESGNEVEFAPASLETLVDSPLIAGKFFRSINLDPGARPAHMLDLVADSAAALDISPKRAAGFSNLVAEANALFAAHHYQSYHFLLTLSDHVGFFGLEHHESSDNRSAEKYLTDDDQSKLWYDAALLPHEMAHSWNGKYRRPTGLVVPDFQQPFQCDLLWVYEGLTEYLGEVLAVRSELRTNADFRTELALTAARLDHQAGRNWRPLSDTTAAAQLLYDARWEGMAWRRGLDFYCEGGLIWLEADVIIRQQTQGRRSLDDFCRNFFGGESGPPKVAAYTFDDVIAALKEVAAYDWREFFQKRIYAINPRAPLGGIESSGWRLAYTNAVPDLLQAREGARKFTDLSFSLGLILKEDGSVLDVIPGSPADGAEIGPAMKLVAVNGRRWTPELLRAAVKCAQTNAAPLELLIENDDFFKTSKLDYHDGERYPCLERDTTKPDLLNEILKPARQRSPQTKP
jgi:predicted metalloprotease with PDZ domain